MTRGLALWGGLATLAAVVVAGVTIAVFPQQPRMHLPPAITVPVPPASTIEVPISYSGGVIGKTTHATLTRGGAATRISGDSGPVFIKKAPMRPTSIGGSSASNGDAGLASGSSTSSLDSR